MQGLEDRDTFRKRIRIISAPKRFLLRRDGSLKLAADMQYIETFDLGRQHSCNASVAVQILLHGPIA